MIASIDGLDPTSGDAAGGTTVTITGGGFTDASDLSFGPASAAGMSIDSDTQITATSPAGTGTVDVVVTTPDGTSSPGPDSQFSYTSIPAQPTVSGLDPTSGDAAGGTTVTITGGGFTDASDLSFGPASAAGMSIDSDTQITATSPAGTGTVDVVVTTPDGTSSPGPDSQFSYTSIPAQPTVSGLDPTSGDAAGGTTVTITGGGFTDASDLSFGPASAAGMSIDSDTQITATSPAGTGTVDVVVTTPDGTSSPGPDSQFSYTSIPAQPTVSGLDPTSGDAAGGTTVTITGGGFTDASDLSFGPASAAGMSIDSDTQITATSPAGTGTVDVVVTTPDGTSSPGPDSQFSYTSIPAQPTVSGLDPTSGDAAGGTTVTITGGGFTDASDLSFGPASAAGMSIDSDTQITATSPAGTGTVDVVVTTPDGTSSPGPDSQFSYTSIPAQPTVSGLDPTSGDAAGGTTVTITGGGFTDASDLSFGPASAAGMSIDSDTQITATSPAGTGTVDVVVTTPDGTSSPGPDSQFSYTSIPAQPTVSGMFPESGPVGTLVIVSGSGLTAAGTGVDFGGAPAATLAADDSHLVVAVPTVASGATAVTVSNPGGAAPSLDFLVGPDDVDAPLADISELGPWAELISFRPSTATQAELQHRFSVTGTSNVVQFVEDAYGPLNADYYAVEVSQLPPEVDAAALLRQWRLAINRILDRRLAWFEPYDLQSTSEDTMTWATDDPVGSVVHIDMRVGGAIANPDDGSVVCSASTPMSWTFSTIWTPKDLFHPVSGNREFGYHADADAFVFYTRGADRLSTWIDDLAMDTVFSSANALWLSLQQGLASHVARLGGQATVQVADSRRYDWAAARAAHWNPTTPRS